LSRGIRALRIFWQTLTQCHCPADRPFRQRTGPGPRASPLARPLDFDYGISLHAEASVRLTLTDTRVVAIVGPRQSGKTTLVRRTANDDGRTFISLDDDQFRRFARDDPAGFVRSLRNAVIDEIQRAPDLIPALKKDVDEHPDPGRYLTPVRSTCSGALSLRIPSPDVSRRSNSCHSPKPRSRVPPCRASSTVPLPPTFRPSKRRDRRSV